MTRKEAIDIIIKAAQDKDPGSLTTTVCEALNISMDTFLRFSQLDKDLQLTVVNNFALQLTVETYGHCSQ